MTGRLVQLCGKFHQEMQAIFMIDVTLPHSTTSVLDDMLMHRDLDRERKFSSFVLEKCT